MDSNSSKSLLNSKYKKSEIEGLPNSLFTDNRNRFFKNVKAKFPTLPSKSVMVIQGGSDLPRFDTDVEHCYFLQESNFYYLTGVRLPDFYAVFDFDNQDVTLFTHILPDDYKVWMTVLGVDEISKKYELKVLETKSMYSHLASLNLNKIYTIEGTNTDSGIKYKVADLKFPEEFKEVEKLVEVSELLYEIVVDTRVIKSAEEIEVLTFVNDITVDSHIEMLKQLRPGLMERDIEVAFSGGINQKYYSRNFPYQYICCSGVDSATLHYQKNDSVLKDGDLLLFDMGARISGYVSDVTSTAPVNGKFTKKQADIYNLVLKANLTVQSKLKPGISWPDMHLLAESVILEGLLDLNILNKGFSIQEMLDRRIAYNFMPHGLGHLLGLEVHDAGGYLSFTPKRHTPVGLKNLRFARVLEEGYFITVEPGIYFVKFLLERAFADEQINKYFNTELIRTYFDFGGVRIEDDIIITKDGS